MHYYYVSFVIQNMVAIPKPQILQTVIPMVYAHVKDFLFSRQFYCKSIKKHNKFSSQPDWLKKATISNLMDDHSLKLGQDVFKIEVYNANLCTDWGGLRGAPGKLIENCNNKGTYDVFHPIKIGMLGNWSSYFNEIAKL